METELLPIKSKNNFRYERKFTTNLLSISQIEYIIKTHSSFFKEIYYPRRINNIYFDTNNLDFYYQNLEGYRERKKVRIRWYGDTFSRVTNPILEIKFRNGLVGNKWHFHLKPFSFNKFNNLMFKELISSSKVPKAIIELTSSLRPTLLNSYKRTYFQSQNKKFRLTLDNSLTYKNLNKGFTFVSNRMYEKKGEIILELKYGLEDDPQSNRISSQFPFRISKSSKYCDGIQLFV